MELSGLGIHEKHINLLHTNYVRFSNEPFYLLFDFAPFVLKEKRLVLKFDQSD
jgi:hypothetical protein